MKLVICPSVETERFVRILDAAEGMAVVNASDAAQAESEIPDADAFFGKITPPMLAAARQLRWVQTATSSLEHYMFPELAEHACIVTNMRGLFFDVIADQVFGYIICFARNLHHYIRKQMAGCWEPEGGESERQDFAAGPGIVSGIDRAHQPIAGATLGIVGVGSIGSEIARRGLAFNMRVIGLDPVQEKVPEGVIGPWRPERLPELLAAADYLVIAAPHTPETYKLFRRQQFRQMKRSAYLINIGRGAIVDLADLTASLQAGEIAGAALDVFETEPLPRNHPLWKMQNTILTPHVAGFAPHIAERHLQVLLDNIGRFVRGEPLRNVVNKKLWF